MNMQRRTLFLAIVSLSILFCCVYFLLQNINTLSPLGRIKNAQEVAKLTGEYTFRSEIDQTTNLSPNTSNYGKKVSMTRLWWRERSTNRNRLVI